MPQGMHFFMSDCKKAIFSSHTFRPSVPPYQKLPHPTSPCSYARTRVTQSLCKVAVSRQPFAVSRQGRISRHAGELLTRVRLIFMSLTRVRTSLGRVTRRLGLVENVGPCFTYTSTPVFLPGSKTSPPKLRLLPLLL